MISKTPKNPKIIAIALLCPIVSFSKILAETVITSGKVCKIAFTFANDILISAIRKKIVANNSNSDLAVIIFQMVKTSFKVFFIFKHEQYKNKYGTIYPSYENCLC